MYADATATFSVRLYQKNANAEMQKSSASYNHRSVHRQSNKGQFLRATNALDHFGIKYLADFAVVLEWYAKFCLSQNSLSNRNHISKIVLSVPIFALSLLR